jgi:hypothetical protein
MPRRSGRGTVPGRASVGARGKEDVGMVAFLKECLNPAADGWYDRERPRWAKLYTEETSAMKNYTEGSSI